MSDNTTAGQAAFASLQTLIWPEPGLCTEQDLYLRVQGSAGISECDLPDAPRGEGLRFFPGAEVGFDTWFNLFNLATWQRHCDLQDLHLMLRGQGCFRVSVIRRAPGRSWDRVDRIVDLRADSPWRLDLAAFLTETGAAAGFLSFELEAVDPAAGGWLLDAAWQTQTPARRVPNLAVAVTTFRREAEVTRTMARFSALRAQSPVGAHLQMIITDNGQTLDVSPPEGVPEGVIVQPNENLGGAGGFTRGFLEAQARGASHCMFMDDDAAAHMESLERTWVFLSYARDSRTAVAGAMINDNHRWAIWENGARFFGHCKPQHMGTDLRDIDEIAEMEWDVSGPAPEGLYGGWWYFAFAIEQVNHLAYPFFVRGDDVSFSLVNDFAIARLNGVASFQESFTDKESPQTWYLDLRSHLAHHLSLPQLEVGPRGVMKIAFLFFLRNLPRMHYDTLAAVNLAIEDVLKGPEFFEENIDMAERRSTIKALTRTEAWRDLAPGEAPGQGLAPLREKPPIWILRFLMKLSLNGLLLPGFGLFGRRITLDADSRGHIGMIWGAREITVLNVEATKAYTVRHSKRAAWQQGMRLIGNLRALSQSYERLSAAYRGAYDRMTGVAFWQDKLQMDAGAQNNKTQTKQEAAE